jgi:hypothetical protein
VSDIHVTTNISRGELLQRLAIAIVAWTSLGALLWHEPPKIFYGTLAIVWVIAHNLSLYYRSILAAVVKEIEAMVARAIKPKADE